MSNMQVRSIGGMTLTMENWSIKEKGKKKPCPITTFCTNYSVQNDLVLNLALLGERLVTNYPSHGMTQTVLTVYKSGLYYNALSTSEQCSTSVDCQIINCKEFPRK
jgi:hypothetical protein